MSVRIGEGCVGLGLQLGGEMLLIGHNGGDLAAFGDDLVLRLGERARVDAAIGAPVSAMEGDGDGPFVEKFVEADEVPGLVGQNEGRHGLTGHWCRLANALLLQPRNELVHGLLEMRSKVPHRIGESLEPLAERRIHVSRPEVGLVQRVGKRLRRH